MAISEDAVREKLKQVVDPELFVNIVDLGLVYEVDIAKAGKGKKRVAIKMTMTSPACPAGPQLIGDSKKAIEEMDGVAEAQVTMVMDPPWTPDRMTDDARDQLGIF